MEDAKIIIDKLKKFKSNKLSDFVFTRKYIANKKSDQIRFWRTGNLDVLKEQKFIDQFPHEDPFSFSQYNSIALVGNSGSLLDSRLGDEIDNHECVIRFNSAPTRKYEEDVGSKTTIRFSIGTLSFKEFEDEIILRSYRKGSQPRRDYPFLKKHRVYVLTDQFSDFCQYLKEDSHKPICSSGWVGLMFCLLVGKRVDMYGFDLPDEDSNFDYHYYNSTRYVERSHGFQKEHRLFGELSELIPNKFKWHKLK